MSRIGKKPVLVPSNVQVSVQGNGTEIVVKGPKGILQLTTNEGISLQESNSSIEVICNSGSRQAKASFGTTRALISNMVKGVTEGWKKNLELNGVGYNAKLVGNTLVLTVGFSHDVKLSIPEGVTCKATGTSIEVESADKCLLGTFAARIYRTKPPEPYLGKGIKYVGQVVRRKAGKTGKK
jgi:large subunit ribosomal protein L6